MMQYRGNPGQVQSSWADFPFGLNRVVGGIQALCKGVGDAVVVEMKRMENAFFFLNALVFGVDPRRELVFRGR